ncbi:MAG: CoA ester lyase [Rhodovibrionaceae bacterium]
MTADPAQRRAPALRRSWLFIGGADEEQLAAGPASGADVLIHELEDFTAPERRPFARGLAKDLYTAWRAAGAVAAVRVNPLAGDGRDDLEAVMAGAPDSVLLPKVESPEQVAELDTAVAELETRYGLEPGSTELVPNVEGARGLRLTYEIATASPRVSACLVASEDMAADLGVIRQPDGSELHHVRGRFLVDCVAAEVLAIDSPYTWTDEAGLSADTLWAKQLGFKAKSTVTLPHAAVINELLTPSAGEIAKAEEVVQVFEAARRSGAGRVELHGSLVEVPIYNNAKALLERATALGVR